MAYLNCNSAVSQQWLVNFASSPPHHQLGMATNDPNSLLYFIDTNCITSNFSLKITFHSYFGAKLPNANFWPLFFKA